MGRPITINHFLVTGNPEGIICAYLSNWTGQAIKIPRNQLKDAKNREEIDRNGIYILIGVDQKDPEKNLVYIGEADNLYIRLQQHAKDDEKDFWTEALAFSSKDEFLTKAHIKYLEYRLLEMSNNSIKYSIQNKNSATKSALPEMAVADMEAYLDNVKIMLPSLGHNIINEGDSNKKEMNHSIRSVFKMKTKLIEASGFISNNGFVVNKGSKSNSKINDTLSEGYKRLRNDLINLGVIKENDSGIIFAKDQEFNSPSAAGSVLAGYPVNGRVAWVDEAGKTLKDREAKSLDQPIEIPG